MLQVVLAVSHLGQELRPFLLGERQLRPPGILAVAHQHHPVTGDDLYAAA